MTLELPTAKAELSTRRQIYVIGVLHLMYVLAYLDRNVLALMVEPIKSGLDITDVQFSIVHGFAFGIFYALFGLPMGYIVDRFSKRWVLFGGIAFWSLATVACGLARNFTTLAIARFGVGAGEAALVPVAYSTISRILPRHRVGLGIAIFSMGSAIGAAVATGVGGYLLSVLTVSGGLELPLFGHLKPWQAVFVLIGLPGTLIALLAFTIPEAPQAMSANGRPAPTMPLRPFLAQNKSYLIFAIGGLSLMTVIAIAMTTWMPAFLFRRYDAEIAWVGMVLSIASLPILVGFFVSGYLADKLYRKGRTDAHFIPVLYGTVFVIILAIFGFYLTDNIWITVGCYGAACLLASLGGTVAAHIQLATPAALRGRLAAFTVAAQHLCGLTIGPLLVALTTDHVFGDPERVGDSIALVVSLTGLLAILLLGLARAPARRAIAREAAASGE